MHWFSCIFGLVISLAGLVTDGIALYTYGSNEMWVYFSIMLSLAVLPNLVIQAFSISWQMADENPSTLVKVVNLLLFGTIHKQWLTIRNCCRAYKTKAKKDYDTFSKHRSDLYLLDLYKSFMKSAPQLVLQIYILFDTKDWRPMTVGTPITSLVALAKGMVDYDIDLRHRCPDLTSLSWFGVILHLLWRLGIVTSRIGAMVLMAAVNDYWAIAYFGIHFVMTSIFAFTMTQDLVRREIAPNTPLWQQCAHGIAMGAALTFSFFNVADSSSQPWMIIMYTYASMQSAEAVVHFFNDWVNTGQPLHGMVAMAIVFGSFMLGLIAMLVYNCLYKQVYTVTLFPSRVSEADERPRQVGNHLEGLETADGDGQSLNERSRLVNI
nr:XK-related protein 6-like [Rhipicephalus microplus]